MADQDEYRIKVSMDPSSATAGGDAIIAKQAQIKAQLQEATAAAQAWGVSLEEAQAALAQIRAEDFSAKVLALKNAMRDAESDEASAAESQAEQTERMQQLLNEHQQKLMQNVFYVHRLAEGFKDLSMGGRLASQGMMDISESLQYMLPPQMAMFVVIGQVVGVLVSMALRHHEVAGAAREHADAEKDSAKQIEDAWKPLNDMLENSLKSLKENKVFHGLAEEAKEFTAELDIQQNTIRTIQAALDRLEDAKFGAQEALLNREEQQALKGKTGEDAEAIRLEYEQKLDDLRGAHEKDKADRAVKEKAAELLDLQNQVNALTAQKTAALSDAQRAHDATKAGTTGASLGQSDYQFARDESERLADQQRAAIAGQADATGQRIPALTDAESAQLLALRASLPQLQKQEQENGPQYVEQIQRLKDRLKALEEQAGKDAAAAQTETYETYAGGPSQNDLRQQAVDAISAKFNQQSADINAQIAAFTQTQEGYDTTKKAMETATTTIDAINKKLEELQGTKDAPGGKIKAAQIDLEAARANATGAGYKADAESEKNDNAQQTFQDKQKRETRDLNLKAQLDRIDQEIKDNQDATTLAILQRQKDQLEARQITNETSDKQAGEMLEAGLSAATGAEGAARAGAAADSTRTDRAAQVETMRSDEKADGRQIDQYKALVELGGNKQQLAELKGIIAKDGADKARALSDIIALFGGQDEFNKQVLAALAQHGQKLQLHNRTIKSAMNGGGMGG